MTAVTRETNMQCFGKISLAFFAFFLVLFPSLSMATTIRAVAFEELLQYAEFIFQGQVIAVESVMPLNGSLPLTCVLFEISEVFKGNHSDDTVELCFLGGINDFRRIAVHELGHGLGLGHEDSVEAIMQSLAGDIEYPTADDIAGVNFLYPVSANNNNGGNGGGGGGLCFIAAITGD